MSDNDFDDDPEEVAAKRLERNAAQPTGGASTSLVDTMPVSTKKESHVTRDLPAAAKPRDSFDGETIFAVGDEGIEWSDGSDEDDGDEGRKVTRKINPP